MHGVDMYIGSGPTDLPRVYSPVTLSHEWPKISRLLFILFCACFGTTMNGFFVASFFVEHTLKRLGNVFLACVGLADLMITSVVMPICAVVLLSGQWDNIHVCNTLQLFTETATYSYSLFFMMVAADNYYRLCRTSAEYQVFLSIRIGFITVSIFTLCASLAAVGVYMDLDYDYCERRHYGNFHFRIITTVLFHGIPCLLTIFYLIAAAARVRSRARDHTHYKRSQQYERDTSITALNITAYILFIISWIPYLVVVLEYPTISDSKYYGTVWIGVTRSVVTSFLYGIINSSFRRAFGHLFNYCCCKSTLSSSFSRHRRAMEYKAATGDVRVHIMHQVVNSNSPQRAASSTRETQEL